jgi:hypothetical protein
MALVAVLRAPRHSRLARERGSTVTSRSSDPQTGDGRIEVRAVLADGLAAGVIGALTVIVIRDRPHRIEPRSFIESLGKGAES